ncbi:MAG: signal peptidase I [Acidobacteriaceae bacterium]
MTNHSAPSIEASDLHAPAADEAVPPTTLPVNQALPAVPVRHHHEVLLLMQNTLTFLVGALFILTFIAQPYRIPSGSMKNTLLVGDFLLVNKVVFAAPGAWRHLLAYEPVQRGDIIVFHYPMDHSLYLVKRVLGVPGTRLRLHHGRVYIDEKLLAEPYAVYIASYPSTFRDEFPTPVYTDPGVSTRWWMQMTQDVHHGELAVPPGEYFVLGDNRNDSLDSRYWGFVPRNNIVGQPFLVYFSVLSSGRSEITGISSDRLTHEPAWWGDVAGAARWDRIFHVIR